MTHQRLQKMQDPQPISILNTPFNHQQPEDLQRLLRLMTYGRWIVVLTLWLTVGLVSLWQLRYRIQLLIDSFTWVALRYGLAYHQGAALGLSLCLGMTIAVLAWHSRNLLFGLSKIEQIRLQQQAVRIRQQGPTHPLWRWVCCGEQKRL
jgi:hypothetical protein